MCVLFGIFKKKKKKVGNNFPFFFFLFTSLSLPLSLPLTFFFFYTDCFFFSLQLTLASTLKKKLDQPTLMFSKSLVQVLSLVCFWFVKRMVMMLKNSLL